MGASLVVQWVRIYLSMKGTWTGSIPGPGGFHVPQSNKPTRHNYQAHVLQLLRPERLKPLLGSDERSHCNAKPAHRNWRKPTQSNKDLGQQNFKNVLKKKQTTIKTSSFLLDAFYIIYFKRYGILFLQFLMT